MTEPVPPGRRTALAVGLLFLLCLAVFEKVWGARFYSSLTHVGHDFAFTALALLEGRNWIDANGIAGWWTPPWFTPAWCAGTAFYADPQATFYSPMQVLALVLDPFAATHVSTLLFGAVAFWGSLALARVVLRWEWPGACLFAVLGMANAFVPLRSAVGEPAYQPLYLWTLLALALCWPARPGTRIPWPSIGVALGLTAWLQFGFGGMMVPAFLATLALCLVMVLQGRVPLLLLAGRAALGGVLAIVLNASKLYESVSLMRNFPRDFYGMPGFPALGDALAAIALALVQPSEWSATDAMSKMAQVRFSVFPHEWALQFGWGAAAVALIAVAWLVVQRSRQPGETAPAPRVTAEQVAALAALAFLLAIPVLLLWSNGGTQALVKRIPVLNSTTWPMRWIVIYLPLAQLALAWPVQAALRQLPARAAPAAVAAAAALVWAGPLTEPLAYYLTPEVQAYDPKPVIRAFHQSVRQGGPIPISAIEVPHMGRLFGSRNDTMLAGASQAFCYNPIYGYRLEAFPQPQRLRTGPALAPDEQGRSLLFNPACLVHPQANGCTPGDGFVLSDPAQRANAERFLARQPFEWQRPGLGVALSWVSQAALLALVGLLAWAGVRWIRRRRLAARSGS